MEKKYCTAVVLAGGSGKRMGTKVHKQYLMLKGYPVLYYSLKAFQDSAWIDEIVLVSGTGEEEYCQKEIVEKYGFSKVRKIVSGGAERYNSVWNGLQQITEEDGFVYIHDGARPWINIEDVKAVVKAVEKEKAVCLTTKITDTVKVVEGNHIVNTLNREELRAAQTPQGFHLKELVKCYKDAIKAGIVCTDDSQLYQLMSGKKVYYVDAKYPNQKITTLEDVKGK